MKRRILDLRRNLLTLARERLLKHIDGLLKIDILIMLSKLRLRRRRIERLRQLLTLDETLRQLHTADRAILLIVLPTGACDIATNDTLNRNHRELLTHRGSSLKFRSMEKFRHILHIDRNKIVRNHILREIKPELRHLGQHLTLIRDCVMQNHIKRRNTIRRHHNKLVVKIINLTNLTFLHRL